MWRDREKRITDRSALSALSSMVGGGEDEEPKPKPKPPQTLEGAIAMASIHQQGQEAERAQRNGG